MSITERMEITSVLSRSTNGEIDDKIYLKNCLYFEINVSDKVTIHNLAIPRINGPQIGLYSVNLWYSVKRVQCWSKFGSMLELFYGVPDNHKLYVLSVQVIDRDLFVKLSFFLDYSVK